MISIFVLGDLGHSPRMCYHAMSFSKLDYFVNLCGYIETEPSNEIVDDVNIDIVPIRVIKNTNDLPFALFALKKITTQCMQIGLILWDTRGTDYIMIQNPPCIPILFVIIVFIKFFSRETELIIDWHNLNYTILNLRYNNLNHPFVRIVKLYEHILGHFADLNITVTKNMRKPGDQFQPISDKEEFTLTHDLFKDIDTQKYKILISSTSFTPDEDFNILLDALKEYEDISNTPPIFLVVTGKGPLRQKFLETVKELEFSKKVVIRTAWLSSEDYPKVLACADLGISLHTSSSGIDLPMKIVDFFGCGVPVISLNFPAIDELVQDGVNGLITDNKAGDAESKLVCRLISEVFTDDKLLATLKEGAMKESELRWDENWFNVLGSKFEVKH
ncbi:Chitobiosyldiphosphodolichol beta-mannosyltransferase [Candida viswanathii]|uniref:Chitobiosyldiphosphodolichol beta-mannosyltransferase n=1 Tax=Candida viswanathii TaxID=5486 RepID=A0A367XSA9_9ASCO|nr:Chitobiosyldiphosphodolichol beta-mannosyltransferase [Candida viswanathii]